MRALYGRHYAERLRAVAGEVPAGASVLELCCGPGTLYMRHLRGRVSSYTGLDLNERFVGGLLARGVDARRVDLSAAESLPGADVVVMQASLYHFLADAQAVLERMLAAAGDRVIISEPVRNLASSPIPVIGAIGRRAADPGAGAAARRFTRASLDRLMDSYRDRLIRAFPIPGGREMVYVLAARPPGPGPQRRSGTGAGS